MAMGYQGKDRANNIQVRYVVKTSGDRWFIPYNDNASTADQLAQCKKMVGTTTDGTDCGVEVDSAPRTP